MEQQIAFTDEELELLQTALAALTDKKEPFSDVFEDITSVFAKGFENFSKNPNGMQLTLRKRGKKNASTQKDDILLLQAKLVQLKRSQQQRSATTDPQFKAV